MRFNGTGYWYVYNAQNDVIGLIDANGEYVVRYTYSAYGIPLSKTGTLADTLGTLNPYRYRGYIYDEETGLYYCNSRYYDPVVCRWINADKYVATGYGVFEHNMFAYCDNHPIRCTDTNGMVVIYMSLLSGSIGCGMGVGGSVGIVICIGDSVDIAGFCSYSVFETIATAGIGVANGVDWEMNSLEDFEAPSVYAGGSASFNIGPVPCYFGIDGTSDGSDEISGINTSSGVGVGVDVHVGGSKAYTSPSFTFRTRQTPQNNRSSANAYVEPRDQYFPLRSARLDYWRNL